MAFKRKGAERTGGTGDYAKLNNGEYDGRLAYVADLGIQAREFKGETKEPCQQMALGIEICGEHVTIDGQEMPRVLWTQPFNVFFKLSEKGNEFKYFRVFDTAAVEGEVADWDAVLGAPCTVVVGKRSGKDGKEFDTIVALNPVPVKYRKDHPKGELEAGIGDSDDPDNAVNQALFGLVKYVFDKRLNTVESAF